VEIRRILCPSDFSESSAHAIEQALSLATHYHSSIAALHVVDPFGLSNDAGLIDTQRRRIERAFEPAIAVGIQVDITVEVGSAARAIIERARRLPADLIVMGTHGASGFEHLVLGSVTEKVLRTATCPVMTVPPRQRATSRLPFKHLLCAVDFSDASLAAVRWSLSLARESNSALTPLHVLESLLPDTTNASQWRVCVRHGKPHVQILEAAATEPSDLIVIGVRGRNPIDMMLLGSTANQVVRRAACPVLTLR
jgi:nucleotide-binding universal stress UspA family protein